MKRSILCESGLEVSPRPERLTEGDSLSPGPDDAVDTRDLGLQRVPDVSLWRRASAEDRILITFDRGFGDLRRYPGGFGPGLIILRVTRATSAVVNSRLAELLQRFPVEQIRGSFITITDTQIRVRRKPTVPGP